MQGQNEQTLALNDISSLENILNDIIALFNKSTEITDNGEVIINNIGS